MVTRKATEAQVYAALEQANKAYAGNLVIRGGIYQGGIRSVGGTGLRFSLTVKSSKGEGARLNTRRTGHLSAACWHAYRDFLAALFTECSEATVHTAQAHYNGAADFLDKFPDTGDTNIGSMMEPCCYIDACDCEPRGRNGYAESHSATAWEVSGGAALLHRLWH
jgi:hypothetical protein